jgi:dGTPase
VRFSEELEKHKRELKRFLHRELYHHPHVAASNRHAESVIGDLFRAWREDPGQLPEHVRERFEVDGEERAIADYVAGMTDRFALDEHRRRFGETA